MIAENSVLVALFDREKTSRYNGDWKDTWYTFQREQKLVKVVKPG
jgi:hypothetical protein